MIEDHYTRYTKNPQLSLRAYGILLKKTKYSFSII